MIFSISFLLIFICNSHSQVSSKKDIITVKIFPIAQGISTHIPNQYKIANQSYFTYMSITNNQDTTISFYLMSCSWMIDNWISDNDSISLLFLGCDINTPLYITLLPHQLIDFSAIIITKPHTEMSTLFRFGFLYFKKEKDLLDYIPKKNKTDNIRIYWSDAIKLEDNLFKYHIE